MRKSRIAAALASAALTATLAVAGTGSAHAATPNCQGNVVDQKDNNGFSARLLVSYDGRSVCVNTWNQTGHRDWTWAELIDPNGNHHGGDYAQYYQYASTGWFPKTSGCWKFFGTPVTAGQTAPGSQWWWYSHCF
ncbi:MULTISPECIES: hypothetical protein [Kitasatospora]|uniref:Secreted protein n=2 Tax=Kitasatospora TaxID=2063 RepID=A0ABT1J320_9ACTN|nr:hypothetical protein [Kitasatospora paracochleata]MCP2311830.1 hypothetical protein [Kitasatospora paracochleata]